MFPGYKLQAIARNKKNNNQTNLFLFRKCTGNQGVIDHYQNLITDRGPRCQAVLMVHKYWNWCRCIQRKDSAGVILTASWFNNINIGYRFHTSIVCHSCCNNVMYISKENLDISGSAWKKYHADMAFLLAQIVLVLKLYIQGKSCVRPMQASLSSQIAAWFWHIIYDIYWYLHSNKFI